MGQEEIEDQVQHEILWQGHCIDVVYDPILCSCYKCHERRAKEVAKDEVFVDEVMRGEDTRGERTTRRRLEDEWTV